MLKFFPLESFNLNIIPQTALVTEGGGQRGIFTAGVLDTWLKYHFNPFEILIGTSAGAQNLSSYVADQIGLARKSITQLSKDKHFFNLRRSVMGRNMVDLDWYFEQVNEAEFHLDIDNAEKNIINRKLLFSATRVRDYKAQFFTPNKQNWLQLLKASSALPFLYRKGVNIDGDYHVDGGLSAPIPVEYAYELGARLIVVIRTVPHAHHKQTYIGHKIRNWVHSHHCPKPVDYFFHNEDEYDKSLAFINCPPKDVKIIEIYPEHDLASKMLGSHDNELEQDYEAGAKAAKEFLVKNYNLFNHLQSLDSKTDPVNALAS